MCKSKSFEIDTEYGCLLTFKKYLASLDNENVGVALFYILGLLIWFKELQESWGATMVNLWFARSTFVLHTRLKIGIAL